jgi:hypothetical protein
MSIEKQIEVITYEQDRLYFFVDQVSLAQKKYDRLFKTFKDAPYLSEGAQFLSDAGRELQFYKDIVEMLDKGYRKQSQPFSCGHEKGEWISVEERLPRVSDKVLCYIKEYDSIDIYAYTGTDEWDNDRYCGSTKYIGITYWMPLPEPPKMKG